MAKLSRSAPKRPRRRFAAGMIGRSIGLLALMPLASRAPLYTRLVWALVRDERMPNGGKGALALGLGYLLVGRDVLPIKVPLLTALDDLVVVALAIDLFLDDVPPALLAEKLAELEIPRDAYDHDVAQIRRLTPGPLRRLVRRVPAAIDLADEAWRRAGVGPRVRSWIMKEEALA